MKTIIFIPGLVSVLFPSPSSQVACTYVCVCVHAQSCMCYIHNYKFKGDDLTSSGRKPDRSLCVY